MNLVLENIQSHFQSIPLNDDWGFEKSTSTNQWTHGYHRYPAKFLPDLVKKLIDERTDGDDVIADLFAGCGTTLLEAKIHGRKSVGVDVNPVARLITMAKINSLHSSWIDKSFKGLKKNMLEYSDYDLSKLKKHERIDYWFTEDNKSKIAFLFEKINEVKNEKLRTFFLCALSNTFKNCSKWLQSSTKPQVDPGKIPSDPFETFIKQVEGMIKKNNDFHLYLKENGYEKLRCDIRLEDARCTSIRSNSIGAIITSPPYVTSYEYADIHQLTGFWFEFIEDLLGFRKKFIGTFYSHNQEIGTPSTIGNEIVRELSDKDKRTAKEVANYFTDMNDVIIEMRRILKPNGHACIVIGNTTFKDVRITSAEVITELLINNGFSINENDTIKRSIPRKLIPTIRDKKNGRFAGLNSINSQRVYPDEYIIIATKN